MVEPTFFAPTSTPSIAPSACDETLPVSATAPCARAGAVKNCAPKNAAAKNHKHNLTIFIEISSTSRTTLRESIKAAAYALITPVANVLKAHGFRTMGRTISQLNQKL